VVFPTTIWTTIRQAGGRDPAALENVADRYRRPVLDYIARRGFQGADAEDLCQDVFVRVLKGGVLAKADRDRGRFRSLLLSVTTHVILDRLRRRRDVPAAELEPAGSGGPDGEFDDGWTLHLVDVALQRLRDQGSPYYDVLEQHLRGQPQDRNKLWIARRKLAAEIRREVAYTCASPADLEAEMRHLEPYLRSKGRQRP
jgi:RNA polymerase sigma factor (sigma-70 family)